MIKKRQALPCIFAVLWLLLITLLLCTPGTEFPKITWKDKIMLDKLIHAALFAILILTWCWFYSRKQKSAPDTKKLFIIITLLGFLYGIGTEIIQELFISFRSFEIPDIIADGVGVAAGYFISVRKFIKT
jgi:VanZ family protein